MSETRDRTPRPPESENREDRDKQRLEPGFDVEMVERVIRRATKLQMEQYKAGKEHSERLTNTDILRIGEELGLDPANVRQAILDVRSQKASPKKVLETGLAKQLFGASRARSSCTVEQSAEAVQKILDAHLADRECLAEVSRGGTSSRWVPATGLATKIQRGLNLGRRAYILSKVHELSLSVAPLDERSSLVTMVADLSNMRTDRAVGWAVGSGLLFLPGGTVLLALIGIPLEIALLIGSAGAGASAVWGTRMSMSGQRAQVKAALDGLLERLKRGLPLEEPRGSLQERFLADVIQKNKT